MSIVRTLRCGFLCKTLDKPILPDIKRTLVSMSERTGMTVSQVTDEVLYNGLLEMQEMDPT